MNKQATAITRYEQPQQQGLIARNVQELEQLGRMCAASGFFQDSRQAAQAMVKIAAGQELGLAPIQAMTGIHVINNRITLSANLMAALLRKAGYKWRITRFDAQECSLVMLDPSGEELGPSSFSMEDAKQAGCLKNPTWQKYPRNMLFARAISNAARWYAPEVTTGCYTPEEMGDSTFVEEHIVEAEISTPSYQPQPHPAIDSREDHPATEEMPRANQGEAPRIPTPGQKENPRGFWFGLAQERSLTDEEQKALLGCNSRSEVTDQRFLDCALALQDMSEMELALCLETVLATNLEDMRLAFPKLSQASKAILAPACQFRKEQLAAEQGEQAA